MIKPKALIFSGYGLNSEEETAYGFSWAGAKVDIIHLNDIIVNKSLLKKYQIISFPGGFSYADDTGSGNAYANKLKNHLAEELNKFIQKDNLVIGICNGCQIISNLGYIPATLLHNDSARLITRWVDMKVTNKSPWLKNIKELSLPIAHGEGKFFISDDTIKKVKNNKQIALQYIKGEMSTYLDLPANPNGSQENIAGMTDETGKILALMPHPERGMFFTQLPNWQVIKQAYLKKKKQLSQEGPGLQIFKNAVTYFS